MADILTAICEPIVSTSHKPMGLHELLQGHLYLICIDIHAATDTPFCQDQDKSLRQDEKLLSTKAKARTDVS
jgi:hypothetical protein